MYFLLQPVRILLCFIPVSYDSKIHFYFVYLVSLITMFSRCPSIILLAILYACLLLNHQTVLSFTPSTISSARHHLQSTITQRYLFNIQSGSAKIPTSNTDRNSAAISSIKSAISKPRIPTCPLIECEFPPLQQINKLGDGSLRSAMQVEDANIQFVQKLIGGIATPLFGPNVNLILSSSASNALVKKVEKKVKGTKIYSLKEGLPEVNGKDEVCVFLTPSSQKDYQVARMLAENGVSTVLVNGSFKVMKCCYVSVLQYVSSQIRNEYSHLMHNNFSYRKNY